MRIFRKLVYIPPLIVFLAVTLCLINIPHIAKASEFEGYSYSPEELTKLEEVKRIDEIQHAQLLEKVKEFDAQQMKNQSHLRMALSNNSSALGTFGDILINPNSSSSTTSSFIGHAAIVSMKNEITIESFPRDRSPIHRDGVQRYDNRWRNYHGVLLYQPKNAGTVEYKRAAGFAEKQIGKPYNWKFFEKNRKDAYYCSQLVWQAWLSAGIDIEKGSIPNGVIAPMDIATSGNVQLIEHIK